MRTPEPMQCESCESQDLVFIGKTEDLWKCAECGYLQFPDDEDDPYHPTVLKQRRFSEEV